MKAQMMVEQQEQHLVEMMAQMRALHLAYLLDLRQVPLMVLQTVAMKASPIALMMEMLTATSKTGLCLPLKAQKYIVQRIPIPTPIAMDTDVTLQKYLVDSQTIAQLRLDNPSK